MPQAGFDPQGEKCQLCLKIVIALPPKLPWLDRKKIIILQLFCNQFSCFFSFLVQKNIEKAYYDRHLECAAPKR